MKILITAAVFMTAASEFSPDFSAFLASYYGPYVRNQMERRDLGSKGSFGGKANRNERLNNQPIVFVHGVSDTAGEKIKYVADWFLNEMNGGCAGRRDTKLTSCTLQRISMDLKEIR
ncbi:hypothetical protein KIN20_025515 [Parelaphostrongylus tenuis]|uniref:Lipase domain-containing protein n=1 Tax=Parelaphostrongylus tenuis TaxID=148309 RepID=A0AAD5NDD7_PARTN|nr:hypothetical protein KIN20_025515 [Parelaphostrongylus tenuis]